MSTLELSDVDQVEDIAGQIEVLAAMLDKCCDDLSPADWQRVVEIIPWHEQIGKEPAMALRKLAATLRN